MKTGLVLCTYNRFGLLKECLKSLSELTEMADYFIMVDDFSTDSEMRYYLEDVKEYYKEFAPDCSVHLKNENKGIRHSLFFGFGKLYDFADCDLAINLDGDAIVKTDFITRLKDLKTRFPDRIISGFNCNHPKNPVLFDGVDYVERKHANGINMCINRNDYETIIRPALLSQNSNWDFSSTHDKNFIITKGSVVQHLGADCSTLGHAGGDVACDF